jgi:hypothetical protein
MLKKTTHKPENIFVSIIWVYKNIKKFSDDVTMTVQHWSNELIINKISLSKICDDGNQLFKHPYGLNNICSYDILKGIMNFFKIPDDNIIKESDGFYVDYEKAAEILLHMSPYYYKGESCGSWFLDYILNTMNIKDDPIAVKYLEYDFL